MTLKYSVTISVILMSLQGIQSLGSLSLDEFTFQKLLPKFPAVLVQFDVAFPYGEKYEIYNKFAQETNLISDLLVASIGVKDYGERENEDLAARLGATDKENYPILKLFLNGNADNAITFPSNSDYTLDNLKDFVRKHTNIYIGLQGCLEAFDRLATEFMNAKSLDQRVEVLKKAQALLTSLNKEEAQAGSYYVKVMEKINENGESFVQKALIRQEKVLKGKLSENKQREIQSKLNILRSFQVFVDKPAKTEL